MHGPGNLEVLDIPAVDFVQAREPGRRKILVMVQPVARLLIGIKQALWCNVVRASGRSAAFQACHGCSSFDVFLQRMPDIFGRVVNNSVQRTASSLTSVQGDYLTCTSVSIVPAF